MQQGADVDSEWSLLDGSSFQLLGAKRRRHELPADFEYNCLLTLLKYYNSSSETRSHRTIYYYDAYLETRSHQVYSCFYTTADSFHLDWYAELIWVHGWQSQCDRHRIKPVFCIYRWTRFRSVYCLFWTDLPGAIHHGLLPAAAQLADCYVYQHVLGNI